MTTPPTPTAVYRAAGHTTFVSVRPDGADAYTVDCTGCGLQLGPDQLPRGLSGDYSTRGLSPEQRLTKQVENFAEKHAAGCRKLPQGQWPGDQAATGRG